MLHNTNKGFFKKEYFFKENKSGILYQKINNTAIDYVNIVWGIIIFVIILNIFLINFFALIVIAFFVRIKFKSIFETKNYSGEYFILKFLAFKNKYNQEVYGHFLKEYENNFTKNKSTVVSQETINTKDQKAEYLQKEKPKPYSNSESKSIWDGYTSALDEFKK